MNSKAVESATSEQEQTLASLTRIHPSHALAQKPKQHLQPVAHHPVSTTSPAVRAGQPIQGANEL